MISVPRVWLLLLAFVTPMAAQNFEIEQPGQQAATTSSQPRKTTGSPTLGWGSNIEIARQARAAETALKNGDYSTGVAYAEQAVHAAPQDYRMWFLLGYAARLAGRMQLAAEAYQHGLGENPSSIDGLSGLAQTYAKMGRIDDAKQLLTRVIAADPRRVTEVLSLAELYLQSGDPQRAVDLLGRAESSHPSSRSELLLALAYTRLGQPDKAKVFLNQARQRAPNNPEVLRALAGYYRQTRDYAAAIETLKLIPSKSADVLAELAYTYHLAGRQQDAADLYARAATAAPKQLSLQIAAAEAQMNLGSVDKAKTYVARAAAIDANHYRVHVLRAEIARMEGDRSQAIKEYTIALSKLPESVAEGPLYPIQLHMTLAELDREAGDQAGATQQATLAQKQIQSLQVQESNRAAFFALRAAIRSGLNDLSGAQADIEQALKDDPQNPNYLLQYGNVLWRQKRPQEAIRQYVEALKFDPNNRFALSSLGYLSREIGNTKAAESYFNQLATAYPKDASAYLALGDLYAAMRQFPQAQESYEKAYKLAPNNHLIIASGANTAIEAHTFDVAKHWLDRATNEMNQDASVMRERERYLRFIGKYQESADLGKEVIQKLPRDRDAIVYLGYDLLQLGQYDDLLALTTRYQNVLPTEPALPLLAGYVHKHGDLFDEALDDFTLTLKRDPNVVTAYVNRGYVWNDLQNPEAAIDDFEAALKREPNNGEAELGIAFSYLELHRGKWALSHVEHAEKLLGESGTTHLIRATAYTYQGLLGSAEKEYRIALKYTPQDLKLRLALADVLYHLRRYNDSINELNAALDLSPDDPGIYGRMAHAYAQLHRRDQTLRSVQAAEQHGGDQAAVLLNTGEALMILGDESAAMDRFQRALEAPDADRVAARLAVARLMLTRGEWGAAREQVGLAFAESRIGDASPVTVEQYVQAADIMLAMHDFNLAEKLFQRAKNAGAADPVVAVGLANVYLAQGQTDKAEAQLASLGNTADYDENYAYLMARGNMYRQKHEDPQALSTFVQASSIAGEDDQAERQELDLAGQEGYRFNQQVSALTGVSVAPVFEDETIYMLDAKLRGITNPALLPNPRSSMETLWTSAYRIHEGNLPTIGGFFQLRNDQGQILIPSNNLVVNRNTWDYNFNGGVNPTLQIGQAHLMFNTGLQLTVRRDTQSPVDMNQNLFRQFLYVTSSPFFNWLSVHGEVIHEAGPFTEQTLHSRLWDARLEFRVGQPWGRTYLITGYGVQDLLFRPIAQGREWFFTSTYAGLEHKFGSRLVVRGIGEYQRSWQVQGSSFVLAQMMRPAVEAHFQANRRWSVDTHLAFSRGMSMHDYDNVNSGVFVSYVKGLHRTVQDAKGAVPIEYPLRLSFGLQQQTFYNFIGANQSAFLPVVRLTLF